MESKKEWTGASLAEDLARTIQGENSMVWTQLPLGSVQVSNAPRADVCALNKSFAHPVFRVYEIKISRGDFFRDVQAGKYQNYMKLAHLVFFAVPSGLIKKEEVPADGVGLIVRTDSTWQVVKAARRNDFKLDQELLLKLLMNGYETYWKEYRSEERRKQGALVYKTLKQAYYDYGVKVAKDIADAQEIKADADQAIKDIQQALGKDYSHSIYHSVIDLKDNVDRLLAQHRGLRLAIAVSNLAERLFDGHIYGSPTKELENLTALSRSYYHDEDKRDSPGT